MNGAYLLDLFLAALLHWGIGPQMLPADAYHLCSATPAVCECPVGSCAKDCQKGACCCKGKDDHVCVPGCALPPCAMPCYAPPTPGSSSYQVSVKVGEYATPSTVVLGAGHASYVTFLTGSDHGPVRSACRASVWLKECNDGTVELGVEPAFVSEGCGGHKDTVHYAGKHKLSLDTPTNFSAHEANGKDRVNVEVMVSRVQPLLPVMCMPPMPMSCPVSCLPPAPCAYLPKPTFHSHAIPEPLPVMPCMAVAAEKPAPSAARCEVVRHGGKSAVCVKGDDGACVLAVRMTLDKGRCGSLTVAAGKSYVHVHGKHWKAAADKVEIAADGTVKLHGHVKLTCEKLGGGASVKARELCVSVKDGEIMKIVDR